MNSNFAIGPGYETKVDRISHGRKTHLYTEAKCTMMHIYVIRNLFRINLAIQLMNELQIDKG